MGIWIHVDMLVYRDFFISVLEKIIVESEQ